MSEETRYQELTRAVHAYGQAAMENLLRCRALGLATSNGLAAYLGAPETCVALVPAQGPFDPKRDYGHEAFSYDPLRPIRLEPIIFGLCVIVPNAEDSQSLWIRTGVRCEVIDERFEVFVANQPMVRLPLEFEGQLEPLFETLMREFMQIFRHELADFGDERYRHQLGFVLTPTSEVR
ncbi:MAG: hypothetical protein V2I43_00170 [Parvularcula sp.]|jgi:hypothetical protein|nr:hypothetical protein [Parvularcula sp.]